ncbi:MAG: ABC transporter permease [Defluviitaleaceae bacterium]|nr:ABC transporter permease [Defluviitaleaceae bacterium]MCL2836105.1 ABC transporter permease [Defluviitaleaceae bacterium]
MSSPVFLEHNVPLDEKRLNIPKEEFGLVEREEVIYDAEFRTKSISYGRDVWIRFMRSPVTVIAAVFVIIIIIMGVVGPYINEYSHTIQHLELNNLPPRIPGLERFGIFDGSGVREIQAANLPNWEPYLIEVLGEFEMSSRAGSIPALRIRVNEYARRAFEYEREIARGISPDPTDMYFWFGSDALGRDLFTRLWQGLRVSLILGFSVVMINLTIGLMVGSVCGYYGGKTDMLLQRVMEVISNIPFLPLAIILIMFWGSGLRTLIIVLLIQGWIPVANNVRVQFYRFKSREYVLASRTMGARDARVMYKHILPNAVGTIVTFIALQVPSVIFTEAFLAYLGLGIEAPNPSIGVLLRQGQVNLLSYPFMIVSPGIIIVTLMLAFNLFGNGLRDAFNPALRK